MASLSASYAATIEHCGDLPASTLEIYDIKTPQVDEVIVGDDKLDRHVSPDVSSSFHTMMLTEHEIAVVFEIDHRFIPIPGGLVCDAPTLVRIGLGFSKRISYLARQAAQDSCVRAAMRAHEVDHQKADADALVHFLDAKRADLTAAVTVLKRTPAPNPQLAVVRWATGLRAVLAHVKQDFLDEEQQVTNRVDAPAALQKIEDACGGRLKHIETAPSQALGRWKMKL